MTERILIVIVNALLIIFVPYLMGYFPNRFLELYDDYEPKVIRYIMRYLLGLVVVICLCMSYAAGRHIVNYIING
jgi:predicted Na+-dependent transporter